jgi:type I restriction enzyme S subunit
MKPYPVYKDSGIEWIGEIPEHWTIKKFKYWFDLVTEKDNGESKKVGLENIESKTGRLLESESNFQGDGISFRVNDILFGKLRPYLAKVYLADFIGSAVGDFFVFRSKEEVVAPFGFHRILSPAFIEITNSSTYGAKMPRVSWEFISNLEMAFPNREEQTAIANFLDHKTAQIDAAIEKHRQLIELLQEHRAALINEAVTKGINPNAPMKDSGIEWIGEIPDHWEVKKLKWIIKINSGGGIKSEDILPSGTYPVYGGNGITGYSEDYNHDEEILVLGRVGAYCGSVYLISGKNWVTDNALVVSTNYNKEFLFYTLTTMNLNRLASKNAQPLITGTLVKDQFFANPPSNEQEQIVNYIEAETTRIDEEITLAQQEIDLLEEYRQALIAEAVTGKIDVRDYPLN